MNRSVIFSPLAYALLKHFESTSTSQCSVSVDRLLQSPEWYRNTLDTLVKKKRSRQGTTCPLEEIQLLVFADELETRFTVIRVIIPEDEAKYSIEIDIRRLTDEEAKNFRIDSRSFFWLVEEDLWQKIDEQKAG